MQSCPPLYLTVEAAKALVSSFVLAKLTIVILFDLARDTTLHGLPTRCEPKRSGRASRLQPNRQAKLPVCAVP